MSPCPQPPTKVEWGALPCPLIRLLYHRPAQAMVQEAEQGSRTPLTSPLLPQARWCPESYTMRHALTRCLSETTGHMGAERERAEREDVSTPSTKVTRVLELSGEGFKVVRSHASTGINTSENRKSP